jgi:hypothetical protein
MIDSMMMREYTFTNSTGQYSEEQHMTKRCAGRMARTLAVILLLALASCGSDEAQNYLYSIDVVNSTASTITVRYDWEYIVLKSDWAGKAAILPGDHVIIEWYSADAIGEHIEVEYQGIKKLFSVPQVATLPIAAQDFQN